MKYLVQNVMNGVLVVGLLMTSSQVFADDTSQLKAQVQALQNRVDQLESQLADKQRNTTPTAIAPTALPPTSIPIYEQWVDPFTQMMMMRDQIDRNMRQAFADTRTFTPKMDMKQMDKQYLITMDMPGMNKDKINIEIKEGMLIISGERQNETQDNRNNQYYRQERSFGAFMQAIPLPDDAKTDQIDAKYKNGVLTVTVARIKKEEQKFEGEKIKVN